MKANVNHRQTIWTITASMFVVTLLFTSAANAQAQWTSGSGVVYTSNSSDKVGVGTTNPGFLFEGQTASSSDATVAISSTLGSPPAKVGFLAAVDSSNRGRYDFFWNGGSGGLALRNGSNAAGNILFFTNHSGTNGLGNETEKMRIDKNGDVGIGTPDPAGYKLNVNGTINSNSTITANNIVGQIPGRSRMGSFI